jgi:hypothetical protein
MSHSVGVTGYDMEGRSSIPGKDKDYSFTDKSGPPMGSTQPPIQIHRLSESFFSEGTTAVV